MLQGKPNDYATFVSTKISMVNRVALTIWMPGIFILIYSEYERGKE